MWGTDFWFKALKCQILLTNTKPFFWHSEANAETFEKFSLYIWVSYKFDLKSVNSLNQILWAAEYSCEAFKCRNWLKNIKHFSWESGTNIETLQDFFSYIWVSHKFIFQSVKSLNRFWCATEYWFKALKCKIHLKNTKAFLWESEANIESF